MYVCIVWSWMVKLVKELLMSYLLIHVDYKTCTAKRGGGGGTVGTLQ